MEKTKQTELQFRVGQFLETVAPLRREPNPRQLKKLRVAAIDVVSAIDKALDNPSPVMVPLPGRLALVRQAALNLAAAIVYRVQLIAMGFAMRKVPRK